MANRKWYQDHVPALISAATAILVALIGLSGVWIANRKQDSPSRSGPAPAMAPDAASTGCSYRYQPETQSVLIRVPPKATALNLSRLFAVPVEEVLSACGSDGVLRAGTQCQLPFPGARVVIYQVQPGDTAYSLATHFNVQQEELLELNCVSDLRSGQVLSIFTPPTN
ncbi:MAG: LysM peptidoglycan-binding domain-containing protein [Acidobacteriota bacterium]